MIACATSYLRIILGNDRYSTILSYLGILCVMFIKPQVL
jgi:hypothetical protein